MKLDWSIMPWVLQFVNLTSNDSQASSSPLVSRAGSSVSGGAHASGASTDNQAPFIHSTDSHHDHNEWRESSLISVSGGEDWMGRPNAGQKISTVEILTKLGESDECPYPPILSCSAKANDTSSCCVVRPGGVMVHAQFWDLDFGVADSWGIHGLWPDKCNGQFYENCDHGRKYKGSQITTPFQNAGQTDLLEYMRTFWVSNNESPENFWAHEWATHGTCVSTLEPSCLEDYVTAQEVVPYFETVVQLFQQLNTYDALTSAGIFPSSTETHTLAELQDAVTSSLGYVPDFTCSGKRLSSVQYYLNVQGPLQDGRFVASEASRNSRCPKSGIVWPPKTVGN